MGLSCVLAPLIGIKTVVVSLVGEMANRSAQLITEDASEKAKLKNIFYEFQHMGAATSPPCLCDQTEGETRMDRLDTGEFSTLFKVYTRICFRLRSRKYC